MTAREMQIEFERRVTLMDPTLLAELKLTSDTIFSFLNAYTLRFVKQCYLQGDENIDGSRRQRRTVDTIKNLITRELIDVTTADQYNLDGYSDRISLPQDYFMYIRSNSLISKNYKLEYEILNEEDYLTTPNKTIGEDNIPGIVTAYYDRAILLNPYAVVNYGNNAEIARQGYLSIIHDAYTIVKKVDLVYYRLPKLFNVLHVDGVEVLNYCELPEDVHMEIVEGAVEMFVTEAKYRLNTKKQ